LCSPSSATHSTLRLLSYPSLRTFFKSKEFFGFFLVCIGIFSFVPESLDFSIPFVCVRHSSPALFKNGPQFPTLETLLKECTPTRFFLSHLLPRGTRPLRISLANAPMTFLFIPSLQDQDFSSRLRFTPGFLFQMRDSFFLRQPFFFSPSEAPAT